MNQLSGRFFDFANFLKKRKPAGVLRDTKKILTAENYRPAAKIFLFFGKEAY